MAPWFLELLGLPNQGRGFEIVWWSLVALIGGWLLLRERRAGRGFQDGWLGWLLGAGLAAFGLWRAVGAAGGRLSLGPDGLLIPSYGVFVAGGLGFCVFLAARDAQRRHDAGAGELNATGVVDLAFWVLIGGVLGARLLYMATEIPLYVDACRQTGDCLAALRFWDGGLVFYGSVPGGLLAGAWWCRRAEVSFLDTADLIMTYLPLGHAIGRLGCYFAGCCFGAECDVAWAVTYPAGSPAHVAHLEAAAEVGGVTGWDGEASHPVHPTVLYEAVASFLLFGWLRFGPPRRAGRGRVLAWWAVVYAAIRFLVEPLRGDTVRGFLVEVPVAWWNRVAGMPDGTPTLLSTSQAVALLAALVGGWWLWRTRGRAGQPASDVSPSLD